MIDPSKFANAKVEPMPDISSSNRIISRLRGLVSLKMFQQRTALDMTQAEYADHIHVSQALVSRIENGSVDLSLKRLFELLEPLELDIELIDKHNSLNLSKVLPFPTSYRPQQTSFNSSGSKITYMETYSSKQIREG